MGDTSTLIFLCMISRQFTGIWLITHFHISLGRRQIMFDFLRRCLLIVVFVLTIGLLFIGGNRDNLKDLIEVKNFHELKIVSNP